MTTILGPEGVLFVRFTLIPSACAQEGVINDAGATHAVYSLRMAHSGSPALMAGSLPAA
ncbi:hypothetical protein [Comamonas sp. JC664]|uniref:hypothetical protein n=1 Tax=Comamonas sp. JC664 TaxID=2801917 RepID=UPI00257428C9|nr:hypothetical protein [Comamonas sp. JC664]